MNGSAVISSCGTYRYELCRWWDENPRQVCWVMLNPSVADADQDDPTIRRCVSFSQAWGFGSLIVVNLFALRSTNPAALKAHPDPIGPRNDASITLAVSESHRVVVAWGQHGALHNRGLLVHRLITEAAGWPVRLGSPTKSGHPRHPLYVAGDTALEAA